ncbi:hypothetical protein RI129_002833 [Pyrocoelia pectoralis]|uniref:Uncharacterized protein n=1 Tax=Pyrocoelia pectoralis TaxID=417401 RepID=A0AAN7VMP4_9COLE
MRPPCGEKCRLGCSQKIMDSERQEIFLNYWKLANLQLQREFITRHTDVIKPKYRYSSTQNFRNLNSAFYFQLNNNRIRVCKFFLRQHWISMTGQFGPHY